MDAVSHRETQTQARLLRGTTKAPVSPATPAGAASRGLSLHQIKRMAMNAITHVETVAQIGWVRLGAGAAVYAAHIRHVDQQAKREAQRDTFPRRFSDARRTGHGFGRE